MARAEVSDVGEAVRHPAKPAWGVGEVVAVTADTIEVRFARGVVKLNAGIRRHIQG